MQQKSSNLTPDSGVSDSINLLDYLEVLVKHKRLIVRSTVAGFMLSLAVSLLLPKAYSSTAKILPPQQDQGMMGMMMGQMGGMASLAGDLLGKGSSADLYVSILKSDAISDLIIDRFKLMQVYDKEYRIDTYQALAKRVEIGAGKKDGIISIAVEDRDPNRAADMANAYVEELGKLAVRLNITGAGENRTFLDEQLGKAKADLAAAEDALKGFQTKNKVVSVTDQASAAIGGIAQLKAQLVSQEVQLAALQRQFTDSSQEVKNAKSTIANLRRQIAGLEGSGSGGSIPAVGSMPELGQQYLRLMRQFKIQETIVEMLTKQHELSKISEAKEIAGVQVIQQARVPDKKSKPMKSLIVLVGAFAAFLVAVTFAFLREFAGSMRQDDRQRWNRIFSLLSGSRS